MKMPELISPYSEEAFSPGTMEKVVRNQIDFELSAGIWKIIDEAFSAYWNDEIGLGEIVYYDEALEFISGYLKDELVLFPYMHLSTIVNIMFDWIVQIPGVLINDEDYEKEIEDEKNTDDNIDDYWKSEEAPF